MERAAQLSESLPPVQLSCHCGHMISELRGRWIRGQRKNVSLSYWNRIVID